MLNISGNSAGGYQNSAEKAMGELRSKLEYAEVSEIITIGLHQYLDSLQLKIIHISDLIDNNFFRIRDNFEHQVSEQSQTQS